MGREFDFFLVTDEGEDGEFTLIKFTLPKATSTNISITTSTLCVIMFSFLSPMTLIIRTLFGVDSFFSGFFVLF